MVLEGVFLDNDGESCAIGRKVISFYIYLLRDLSGIGYD